MPIATSANSGNVPKVVRILLVEDNAGDVYLLEKALKSRFIDYELTCLEDRDQAVRALAGENAPVPDLILIDLNLPEGEGFDVLRLVRNKPAFAAVPVGVFTSSDAVQDRHRVSNLGVKRYIHNHRLWTNLLARSARRSRKCWESARRALSSVRPSGRR